MLLASILSRFNSIHSSSGESRPHVMKLAFPVCALLPEDHRPYLGPPQDVAHRCQPPGNRGIAGLLNVDFPIALQASAATTMSGTAPHHVLLHAVSSLASSEGSSALCAVTFIEESTNQVVCQFRLSTATKNGISACRYFKLNSSEMNSLFALATDYEWISMLQHLISRGSERAYYHVRARLSADYGLQAALDEERDWDEHWSQSQCHRFKELFQNRTERLFPESAVGDRNTVRLRLPCGDVLSTTTTQLEQMTENDYRTAQCPMCQAAVLSARDICEVEVAAESISCEKQHRKNAHWAALDHEPEKRFWHFDGKPLAAAIRAALGSFVVSPLVSPSPLCFAGSKSTQSIMHHFENFFATEGWEVDRMPGALVDTMIQDALQTTFDADGSSLGNSFVPPGFIESLFVWLRRAVNFFGQRQCSVMRANHLGIHRHDDQLVINPALWKSGNESAELVSGSGDEQDSEISMDTLSADMMKTDLMGTSSLHTLLGSMDMMGHNEPDPDEEL